MSDEEKDLRDEIKAGIQVKGGAGAIEETEVESMVEGEIAQPSEASLTTTGAIPVASERTWAALAHASVLLTFALGLSTGGLAVVVAALVPLAIWLAFRDRSRFVAYHAMQATVFQLASLVLWIGLLVTGVITLIPVWVVTALLLVVLIGFLLLPLVLVLTIALPVTLAALPFASLVYGLYGAFEVYAGRPFRYWRVADWIESRGVRVA